MLKKVKWKILIMSFLITSCTTLCETRHEDMSSEEVLQAYLNTALSMTKVIQRNQLLELTKGPLNQAIATATEETIQEAYLDRKQDLENFSIIEKSEKTPREVEITFHLIYNELPEGVTDPKQAASITTENTVSMIREDHKWYIKEVVGNKTSIDFPISDLSIIRGSKTK